jgi:hypothetical protein
MKMHDANRKPPPPNNPSRPSLSGAVLTSKSAATLIKGYLASRDWWLLVTNEPRGNAFVADLERTYYSGEANRDFEVAILPALAEGFGVVSLFLAKKSRMPPEQLQREFAARVGPITVEELRARDVLFPHPDMTVAAALARFVGEILGWCPRPEDN